MSDMTRKTVSVYTKHVYNDGSKSSYNAKLGEMYSAGKTNGYSEVFHEFFCDCSFEPLSRDSLDQLVRTVVTRFWTNQESAQEWNDFLISLNAEFDQGLKSTDILTV